MYVWMGGTCLSKPIMNIKLNITVIPISNFLVKSVPKANCGKKTRIKEEELGIN